MLYFHCKDPKLLAERIKEKKEERKKKTLTLLFTRSSHCKIITIIVIVLQVSCLGIYLFKCLFSCFFQEQKQPS